MSQPTYLQEKLAEDQWAHILTHDNIKDGMKNEDSVKRFGANWRYFYDGTNLEEEGLKAVPFIATKFQAYLESKKGDTVNADDISTYVANKVWNAKLKTNSIVNDRYKLLGIQWLIHRGDRGLLHEAASKSVKEACKKYLPSDTPEAFISNVLALFSEKFDQFFLAKVEEKTTQLLQAEAQ
jgi:hypothetical protein